MSSARLIVDIRGYWHPGGGRGGGKVIDAIAHRDSTGLPVLPGRHLKGLLREACESAADWGWDGFTGLAERLFGERHRGGESGTPAPGCLRIGDARLPAAVADWLASDAGTELQPGLFRPLHATAVEHDTGTAKERSLRGTEVVVPLCLEAEIRVLPGHTAPEDWRQRLEELLPLIRAVGGRRSRGLGRANLSLREGEA